MHPGVGGRLTLQKFLLQILVAGALLMCGPGCGALMAAPESYGVDAGGSGYSDLAEVTPANVKDLVLAWSFHDGDLKRRSAAELRRSKFEVMPILADDKLVICTAFNEVIALDPKDGTELWRFDPHIATDYRPANLFNCRGVALWRAAAHADGPCARRILTVTNDARLIALDLASGKPCADFGSAGEVRIDPGKPLLWPGEWQMTSAPAVVGDTVVVGSAIGDNARVSAPRGTVRAFDVRSGALRWTWDPIPTQASDPATASWGDGWQNVGAANVWAPISVDSARGWVFLPTSSPSPDFYGGLRPGANLYGDAVVALDARSGTRVWSFQTVHHDVWDYDLASEPALATIALGGAPRDVVVQGTKTGFIYVLDRATGEPVLPVEERAVPQGGVAGEVLAPTQPFPRELPPLVPSRIAPENAYGITPWDRNKCRDRLAAARSEGIFTPPSLQGTLVYPFTGGGVNWGGLAVDAARGVVYVNASNLVHLVTLFPAEEYEARHEREPGKEISAQRGAPYGMEREVLLSPLGLPCNPPPWGTLAAVDLKARRILWQKPLGTTEELSSLGIALNAGTPTFGGPLATAGGLVFIGATLDHYLRAFDAASGTELWAGRLPASGIATPTTYLWQGHQYIVIAAGGHGDAGAAANDAIVAFALPAATGTQRTLTSRVIDRPGGRFQCAVAAAVIVLVLLVVGTRRRRRR